MTVIGETTDAQAKAFEDKLNSMFGEQTPEQTTETQVEAQPEAQTQSEDLRTILESEGFDLKDKANKEVAEILKTRLSESEELRRQLAEQKAQAEQYRLYLEQQQLQAKQAQVQPEAQASQQQSASDAKEAVKKWQKVQIDSALEALCERDASGMYTPKSNYGAPAVEAANALNNSIRERARRIELFISDPSAALSEAGVEEAFNRRVEEAIKSQIELLKREQQAAYEKAAQEYQQQASAIQEQNATEKFYQDHKAEYFVLDANGNPSVDPLTQRPRTTEKGEKFRQICKSLIDSGMGPQQAILQSASFVEDFFASRQSQQQQTPEEKKRAFLSKDLANRQAEVQSSSRQSVEDDYSPNLSLKEMFLRDPANAEMLGTNYRGV